MVGFFELYLLISLCRHLQYFINDESSRQLIINSQVIFQTQLIYNISYTIA